VILAREARLRRGKKLKTEIEIGQCTLTDADHSAGNYKPKEGISETGRMVVLQMPAG
jgi:hypothetical protein